MLKILHTADWHLGRRFPSFPEEAQKKLSRARMDVIATILDVARRNAVDAVLCAGDLFDDPTPAQDFWEGLAVTFRNQGGTHPPVFRAGQSRSAYLRVRGRRVTRFDRNFRSGCTSSMMTSFSMNLRLAQSSMRDPVRSKAGENDLAMSLPAREPGDARIRIGCVHGSTFDMDGYQTNFPISRDAGVHRGLDYLAIGDTHSFRDVTASSPVPTIYPGAPEPTTFDEPDAGYVALVALFRHGTRPRVSREPVAFWRWIDQRCRDLNELRTFMITPDLERHVVRLHLDMTVSVAEESEVERILRDLEGTDATHGRAGVLLVDKANLKLQAGSAGIFPDDLPPVLRDTIARLDRMIEESIDEAERSRATRALAHLYKLLQSQEGPPGRAL